MTIDRRILFWFAALIAFLLFLYIFSPILLPFVAGMMLAYLLDPVADWLQKGGFSRLAATLFILVLFLFVFVILVVLVLPILINQLFTFIDDLPSYVKRIEELLGSVLNSGWAESLGVNPDVFRTSLAGLVGEGASWLTTVAGSLWSGGQAVINIAALLVVTPIVAFYLLYDWDRMIGLVDQWLPRDNAEEIRDVARQIDSVVAAFVRGQSLVGLILGAFYAAGLVMLGVNFGFLIGLVAGVVSFIPYLGSTLGFVAAVGIALLQFWPDWIWVAATAILFVVGQILEGYVLQPYFIGQNVGLHPVWLMFALFAFGLIFGFVGLLVAIPAAAAIGVLVRRGLAHYLASPIYRGNDGAGDR